MDQRKMDQQAGGGELEIARRAFVAWRRQKVRRGAPIPDSLWRKAVAAAKACGPTRTRKALKLNGTALKKRIEEQECTATELGGGFVEFPLSVLGEASASESEFELWEERGCRLRVVVRGRTAHDVGQIAQSLWSATR